MLVEPVAGLRPAVLRAVAECEQGLSAPLPPAGSGHRHHVLRLQVLPPCAGRLGEGAIRAGVKTKSGEGYEDLARVGHGAAVALVAQPGSLSEQRRWVAMSD